MLELVPKFAGLRTVPSFSVSLKTTVGLLPGFVFVTEMIVAFSPLSCLERYGTVWAPLMDASNSWPESGTWHAAQALSLDCGPAGWPAPVTQLMLSWQEPHAAREGFVYQTSDPLGLFAGSRPSWQFAQLRMSCGNSTVE